MSKPSDPVARADDAARALARHLMALPHAALAFVDPQTATPGISRIAFGLAADGTPLTLISALAPHFAALSQTPDCALLLGEPGPKGDPLTHPRLMLRATAEFVPAATPDREALRETWLAQHPKSQLYVDFADFAFVRLRPRAALLNAGFGKAFHLEAADLLPGAKACET